jgi:hypothetical protein
VGVILTIGRNILRIISPQLIITTVIVAVFTSPILLFAQSDNIFVIQRLTGPIEFDGISNEPAWESIPSLPVIMYQPVYGNNPSENTEIRIAYNDDYLYVSGRLYDSEPEKMQVVSLERDGGGMGNDWFGIVLDTFDDNENAVQFFTTPEGNRFDAAVLNDAEGEQFFNVNWNSFWDAAVVKNNNGWFAEIRVPWSSLRFQAKDGQVKMGLITWRYIARKNEFIIFPDIPPNWNLGFIKPSQAQDIAYNFESDITRELGLDLKYGITSNLTLDLTLNTDFAQVESDDPQVNLTRFSLFFPEKRLFFQERDNIFNFTFGGPTKLFYSRRIGLYDIGDDDYRQVPIIGGLRLTGRIGKWDIGLLEMQTSEARFEESDEVDSTVTVPSENFGVARIRKQVFNQYSYIGGIFTSRIGKNDNSNYNLGFDGSFRIFGDDYLIFAVAQTFDSDEEPASVLDANRIRVSWENRSNQGFSYNFLLARRGQYFTPRSGFEVAENYFVIGRRFSYAWFAGEKSKVLRHRLAVQYYFLFDNSNEVIESAEIKPLWAVERKDGSSYQIGFKSQIESLTDTLDLPGDVIILPKRYGFSELDAIYQTVPTKFLSTGLNIKAGTFYDGHYFSFKLTPQWNLVPHFTIGGSYQPTVAWFPDRDQKFNYHLIGLRIAYALNSKVSARTFINFNSADDAIGINFRFRYNPREGTDLYFVYNEGFNTDRNREFPTLPLTDNRTILIKYSTTFTPHLTF